jgi:hypothetical protein
VYLGLYEQVQQQMDIVALSIELLTLLNAECPESKRRFQGKLKMSRQVEDQKYMILNLS